MSNNSLPDRYSPEEVEGQIYSWWEEKGYFKAEDVSTKPPFCIILPPPNVTGSLHLGHALDHSIQDCLIRWKRMQGFNALWLPGTDHAGIATQNVVEKELKKQNVTRQQLGREKFIEKVWEWKEKYGSRIISQMKRLGDSCDWDRHVFTMDENVSRAVRRVFTTLYKNKKLYQGTKLINWCPRCETALSDLEVEHRESKGNLWHIDYPVIGTGEVLTVATTRPETMFGDTAVSVNPDDDRYRHLIGKSVHLPLTSKKIPIIADKYVDKTFGSGALKITPAHDFNDYKIGETHNLEVLNIITPDGHLNDKVPPEFVGMSLADARKKAIEALKNEGKLRKEESHNHSVGRCSRCDHVVEPYLSKQWFVAIADIAEPAKRVVETGTTSFEPENWTKTYLHWMNKIEDWCISRQLWWGHRIPAWYCDDGHVTVAMEEPKACETCQSEKLVQDPDVLDTWFSSALWPFSTLGWPGETEAAKTFYPTDVLVTGHDIIFFWVARMIMMGLEFKRDVPFRKVYIHGLIRDSQGRKMSKSLNNSVDPVEAIDKFGADALRYALLSSVASGRDLKFSMEKLEASRNFMNKIWNATRFSLATLKDFVPTNSSELPAKAYLSVSDQWITYKLAEVEKNMEQALAAFRFSDAANHIYAFIWHDFCDWYLEFIKPIMYGPDNADKAATSLVLATTLNRMMRLLHPFCPFISEYIYQKLPVKGDALICEKYPTIKTDKTWLSLASEKAAFEMELVKETITAIRNIRGENRIKPGEKVTAKLVPSDGEVQKILGNNKSSIITLGKLGQCDIGEVASMQKCAVTPVRIGQARVDVVIPLEGLVDFDEEIKRIKKNIEKIQKDIQMLNKKLGNEEYVKNAPQDVVEQDRLSIIQLKSQLESLQESLSRLQ